MHSLYYFVALSVPPLGQVLRVTRGPCWALVGLLGRSWALLGRSWDVLEVLLVALGALLPLSLAFLRLRRAL